MPTKPLPTLVLRIIKKYCNIRYRVITEILIMMTHSISALDTIKKSKISNWHFFFINLKINKNRTQFLNNNINLLLFNIFMYTYHNFKIFNRINPAYIQTTTTTTSFEETQQQKKRNSYLCKLLNIKCCCAYYFKIITSRDNGLLNFNSIND